MTNKVVTCLKPLDTGLAPSFVIGLGYLRDEEKCYTDYILVWFLEKQQLGLVYNYPKELQDDSDEECNEDESLASRAGEAEDTEERERQQSRASARKGSFIGVDFAFSMAVLEGDFRFEDGEDPANELQIQLDQDITFYLQPFAYQGFRVEDACRYEGVIRPMCRDLLMRYEEASSM